MAKTAAAAAAEGGGVQVRVVSLFSLDAGTLRMAAIAEDMPALTATRGYSGAGAGDGGAGAGADGAAVHRVVEAELDAQLEEELHGHERAVQAAQRAVAEAEAEGGARSSGSGSGSGSSRTRTLRCRLCGGGMEFADLAEMKEHFRSEEHVQQMVLVNSGVKDGPGTQQQQQQQGKAEHAEEEEEDDDEDEDEDEDEDDDDEVDEDEEDEAEEEDVSEKLARVYEGIRESTGGTVVSGRRRPALTVELEPERPAQAAQQLLVCPYHLRGLLNSAVSTGNRTAWVVLLLRSGRFAGAVYEGDQLVKHKCFQRYTVRRKAGGAQSARDNSGGGRPKSVGAWMRRQGEKRLEEEVREQLNEWAEDIRGADAIFVTIPVRMQSVVFGYDGAQLSKDDARIINVPIMVHRPTLKEVKRVHQFMQQLYIVRLEPATVAAAAAATTGDTQSSDQVETVAAVDPTAAATSVVESAMAVALAEHPLVRDHLALLDACVQGRLAPAVEILTKYWEGVSDVLQEYRLVQEAEAADRPLEGTMCIAPPALSRMASQQLDSLLNTSSVAQLTPTMPEVLQADGAAVAAATASAACAAGITQSPTTLLQELEQGMLPLHAAAQGGNDDLVYLLLELGACPSLHDFTSRTPYERSTQKAPRDAIRRFRANHEDKWDWAASQVPSGLTAQDTMRKKDKKKEKRRRQKERKKQQKREAADSAEQERQLQLQEEEEKQREQQQQQQEQQRRRRRQPGAHSAAAPPPAPNRRLVHCHFCGRPVAGVPLSYDAFEFCRAGCVVGFRAERQHDQEQQADQGAS